MTQRSQVAVASQAVAASQTSSSDGEDERLTAGACGDAEVPEACLTASAAAATPSVKWVCPHCNGSNPVELRFCKTCQSVQSSSSSHAGLRVDLGNASRSQRSPWGPAPSPSEDPTSAGKAATIAAALAASEEFPCLAEAARSSRHRPRPRSMAPLSRAQGSGRWQGEVPGGELPSSCPTRVGTAGGGSQTRAASMGASLGARRLPPPSRVPQRQRKKRALEASRSEISDPATAAEAKEEACCSSADGISDAALAAAADDREECEDFEEVGADLLQDALSGEEDEGEDEGPSYDALLETLRSQLRASHGEQLVGRLTDTQVISRASGISDVDGLEDDAAYKERVLQLLEVRRQAEKTAAGKHRHSRSAIKKKQQQEKKLDRDYIKREIKNAYAAQINQNVRFFNSIAIRVQKGEKTVDQKMIDHMLGAQEGQEPKKATKEERVMERRLA